MEITLSHGQLDEITRIVREVTINALPPATKELVKRLVLAGHSPETIATDFAKEGATRCAVNGVRWYAEECEGCLLYDLTQEWK